MRAVQIVILVAGFAWLIWVFRSGFARLFTLDGMRELGAVIVNNWLTTMLASVTLGVLALSVVFGAELSQPGAHYLYLLAGLPLWLGIRAVVNRIFFPQS